MIVSVREITFFCRSDTFNIVKFSSLWTSFWPLFEFYLSFLSDSFYLHSQKIIVSQPIEKFFRRLTLSWLVFCRVLHFLLLFLYQTNSHPPGSNNKQSNNRTLRAPIQWRFAILLTRMQELFNLLKIFDPSLFYNKDFLKKKFCGVFFIQSKILTLNNTFRMINKCFLVSFLLEKLSSSVWKKTYILT